MGLIRRLFSRKKEKKEKYYYEKQDKCHNCGYTLNETDLMGTVCPVCYEPLYEEISEDEI